MTFAPAPAAKRARFAVAALFFTNGALFANVEIDVNGQRLVASITVEAARDLGLQEGKSVTAIVKASDVILAAD